jgi:hypothetical protein
MSSWIDPGESYLNDLATALQDIGCTLAIGAPDDTIEMSEKRLLYFQSSESGWTEMFRLASKAARAVIVIPERSPGVGREIRDLASSGSLSKVIIFMPPTPTGFEAQWIMQYVDTKAISIRWSAVQRQWECIGISLPDYDKAGMLFALDSSGKPHREVKLNGRAKGLDFTPIRELTKTLGGSSMPVSVLVPMLERLEASWNRHSLLKEVLRLIGLGY